MWGSQSQQREAGQESTHILPAPQKIQFSLDTISLEEKRIKNKKLCWNFLYLQFFFWYGLLSQWIITDNLPLWATPKKKKIRMPKWKSLHHSWILVRRERQKAAPDASWIVTWAQGLPAISLRSAINMVLILQCSPSSEPGSSFPGRSPVPLTVSIWFSFPLCVFFFPTVRFLIYCIKA